MKKYIKAIALVLAVVMLLPGLSGCKDNKRAVYSIDGATITDDLYRYWLSYYKSYFAKNFQDIEDSKEGWSTEISDGLTAEQYVKQMVDRRMKMYVCALKLYNDYGLELSSASVTYIDETIEEQIEYYGGRAAFENALFRSCNITIDGLRKSYEIETKVSQLQQYLYGENGIIGITDQMLDEYYKSNYSRIKYMYFDRVNKYLYDDEGNIKKNASGEYMTAELTEAEKAEVKSKAEDAFAKAKEGMEFNDLIVVFNTPDMNFAETMPDGFYVSSNSYSSKYVYTLVSNALEMKTGEIVFAEDEYAYYVIAKYSLINDAYKNDESGQLSDMSSYALQYYYEQKLCELFESVAVDAEYVSMVGMMDVGKNVNI